MKPFWTTFYSYKGGVGRSLALANVAAILVECGHNVVLLDFDLEAPGLDTFSEFADAKGKLGIVEYAAEFIRQQAAPDISQYVHSVNLSNQLRGKLWVMPAGRKDPIYNHLLTRIHWAEMYASGLGAPFIENWKASIEEMFQPDYVLIDSRTGLTEIGGVCTTAFPDLVVMLFGLNEQNIDGTAIVARHIRDAKLERTPQLHFVATPIPNLPPDKNGLLLKRFSEAEKVLGIKVENNSIRYWPTAALTERLFVLERTSPEPGMIQDHRTLCKRIMDFNRNGLDFFEIQTEEAIKKEDAELGSKLIEVLTKEYAERPEALFMRSRLAKMDGRNDESIKLAEQAFERDPLYEPPFQVLVAYYDRMKQLENLKAIFEKVLNISDRLPLTRKRSCELRLSELCMFLEKYQEASSHYDEILKEMQAEKVQPESLLQYRFNAAEAGRRAGKSIQLSKWQTIINLFEKSPIAGSTPIIASNYSQAMHIPYALTGHISKAVECLNKAKQIAETVNDLEKLFSVRNYCWISRSEFLALNDELFLALEQRKLWDGTILPDKVLEIPTF